MTAPATNDTTPRKRSTVRNDRLVTFITISNNKASINENNISFIVAKIQLLRATDLKIRYQNYLTLSHSNCKQPVARRHFDVITVANDQ